MKKCIKCGLEKPESEFYRQVNKNLTIGTCKKCHCEIMKRWQKEHPEKCKQIWTKHNRTRHKGRICKWCGANYKIATAQQGCSLKCRFELSIEKKETGCWHWTKGKGGRKGAEYGHMFVDGKHQIASRVSYEMHNGKIIEGMMVLHTCDNPICVNPSHLYLGDAFQNAKDCNERGRGNLGKTHFKKYSPEKCLEVLRLREIGKLYREISEETGVKEGMCKFICKNPQRIKETI